MASKISCATKTRALPKDKAPAPAKGTGALEERVAEDSNRTEGNVYWTRLWNSSGYGGGNETYNIKVELRDGEVRSLDQVVGNKAEAEAEYRRRLWQEKYKPF